MERNIPTKVSKHCIRPHSHGIATNGANITSHKVFFVIGKTWRKYVRMTLVLSVLPYTEGPEVGGLFALYCLNTVFLFFASGQQKTIFRIGEDKINSYATSSKPISCFYQEKKKYIESYPSNMF